MSRNYLRRTSLIVTAGAEGLDLSEMRIQFRVNQMDVDAPNTAIIRVFNLATSTGQQIQKEFQEVVLQAGYEDGNFAIIFKGTIKQVKRGRLNATDTYVDILAADGDIAYNFGVVNKTLAAGATPQDQVNAISEATSKFGVTQADNQGLVGGTLPRGKVLFGMYRDRMDDVSRTNSVTWSVQNGKIVVIPVTGYLPGEAVVLTSRTGMIGVPEATNDGIKVDCLLNPLIKIGTRLQINNKSINNTTIREQGFPRYTDLTFIASLSADGYYRALVVEHEGDNRGDAWYTHITCLNVDPTAAAGNSVQANG